MAKGARVGPRLPTHTKILRFPPISNLAPVPFLYVVITNGNYRGQCKVRLGPVRSLRLSVRCPRALSASLRIGSPLTTCGTGPLSHESDSPPTLGHARKKKGGDRPD